MKPWNTKSRHFISNSLLESRIRKLEQLVYEDSFDDEIDAIANTELSKFTDFDKDIDNQANKILAKNMPVDLDGEIEDTSIDLLKSKKYHTFSYNTIEDLIADIDFEYEFTTKDLKFVYSELLNDLSVTGEGAGLTKTRELQSQIKEINKITSIRANYTLVKAIKAKLKDIDLIEKLEIKYKHDFEKLIERIKYTICKGGYRVVTSDKVNEMSNIIHIGPDTHSGDLNRYMLKFYPDKNQYNLERQYPTADFKVNKYTFTNMNDIFDVIYNDCF